MSTLPRPLDCRPNERHGTAPGIWLALSTLWCDDGPRDRGQSSEAQPTNSEPCTPPWVASSKAWESSCRVNRAIVGVSERDDESSC